MAHPFKDKKVLITAGPTREYIDPVRYISNDSSGKMGYALARAATGMGAKVTLVTGPTTIRPPRVKKFIPVTSANEMYRVTLKEGKKADVIICAAAVADFRPRKTYRRKIKKTEGRWTRDGGRGTMDDGRIIELVKNPDILKTLGKQKRRGQLLVGFALETENLEENALKKLKEKNCDIIIANSYKNIGKNKASITALNKYGERRVLRNLGKTSLAKKLIDFSR